MLFTPSSTAIHGDPPICRDTAVLETTFETATGKARVFDCLPLLDGIHPMGPMRELLRIVEGVQGTVSFHAAIDPRQRVGPRHDRGLGVRIMCLFIHAGF